jgi:adenylate kinase
MLFLMSNWVHALGKVVIILGQPGAGKGTQSQMLGKILQWPVFGASNILRAETLMKTPLSILYDDYISHDKRTRDIFRTGLMMQNIAAQSHQEGIILEGWPNTSTSLNTLLLSQIPRENLIVLELVVSGDELLKRIINRKQCPKCGASYSQILKEIEENICDNCNETLIIRKHDNEKEYIDRLKRFNIKQNRFREAYDEHKIEIIKIDAEGSPEEVYNRIIKSQLKS